MQIEISINTSTQVAEASVHRLISGAARHLRDRLAQG